MYEIFEKKERKETETNIRGFVFCVGKPVLQNRTVYYPQAKLAARIFDYAGNGKFAFGHIVIGVVADAESENREGVARAIADAATGGDVSALPGVEIAPFAVATVGDGYVTDYDIVARVACADVGNVPFGGHRAFARSAVDADVTSDE